MSNVKTIDKEKFLSLKELINAELRELNVSEEYLTIEDFVTDGKKCVGFIKKMLYDDEYELPDELSNLYNIAEMRARHSVVTFLMGLVFKKFGNIFNAIPTAINIFDDEKTAKHMWLITSLYHDIAYSSNYISDSKLNYCSKFTPYLLNDIYCGKYESINYFSKRYLHTLAYTYKEILSYDKYARDYHEEIGDLEKIDHGILGGIITFERLAKKAIKQNLCNELTIIKACSLTISQHNIYKSSSKDDDIKYMKYPELDKLHYNSSFRINLRTPLLLFLCLIDSIECVKKFSREQNSDKNLQTLTVLNSIKAEISESIIKIDFSELHKRIIGKDDKYIERIYKNYITEGLLNLQEWTSFVAKTNDCKDYIEIVLN